MLYIGIRVVFQPHLAGSVGKLTMKETISRVAGMWPIVVIMGIVLGGIYTGIMTPIETAGVGAVVALIFALGYRRVSWSMLKVALSNSVKTSSFILAIMFSAQILSATLAMLRIPSDIVAMVTSLPVPPLAILVGIYVIYLFLGCFMDGTSMMVLTLPFVYPVITTLGFDGIWFGASLMILIEASLLTPPVGINVFTIHGLVPHRPVGEIILGSMSFFLVMLVCLAIPNRLSWYSYLVAYHNACYGGLKPYSMTGNTYGIMDMHIAETQRYRDLWNGTQINSKY